MTTAQMERQRQQQRQQHLQPPQQQQQQQRLLRDVLGTVGTKAVDLYATTKQVVPSPVRFGIGILETTLQPLCDPVANRWRAHAEPLVDMVDSKIARVNEVVVRPCMEDMVIPAKDYVNNSIHMAHDKVMGSKDVVVDRVNEQVVKPCQTKVVAPAEELFKNIKDGATEQATSTISTILEKTNDVVDKVLPENGEEAHAITGAPPADVRQATKHLTSKVSSRLRRRVYGACRTGIHRTQQMLFLPEILTFLHKTFGLSEDKLALAIDRVLYLIPSEETSNRIAGYIARKSPVVVRPYIVRGTEIVTPLVNYGFRTTSSALLSLRNSVLAHRRAHLGRTPSRDETRNNFERNKSDQPDTSSSSSPVLPSKSSSSKGSASPKCADAMCDSGDKSSTSGQQEHAAMSPLLDQASTGPSSTQHKKKHNKKRETANGDSTAASHQ